MRRVIWTDKEGLKRVSLLRDNDPEHMARAGLQLRMPIEDVDFEEVKKDLNNILIDRGLFTMDDLRRSKDGLRSAVLFCLRLKLLTAYKNKEKEKD